MDLGHVYNVDIRKDRKDLDLDLILRNTLCADSFFTLTHENTKEDSLISLYNKINLQFCVSKAFFTLISSLYL